MASRDEKNGSVLDTAYLYLAVLVLAVSIAGYYWYAPVYSDPVRIGGLLIGAVIAVVIAAQSAMGRLAWSYVRGARIELRRVVWPNRQETIQTTLMVIVVVVLLAIFMWAVDIVLAWGVQLLTGRV